MSKHDPKDVDLALNRAFATRRHAWPKGDIAVALGFDRTDGGMGAAWGVVWKIITGYTGPDKVCPRRVYTPTDYRLDRSAVPWAPVDSMAIKLCLRGDAMLRQPPVDPAYLATVLMRPVAQVAPVWEKVHEALHADPLGRKPLFTKP